MLCSATEVICLINQYCAQVQGKAQAFHLCLGTRRGGSGYRRSPSHRNKMSKLRFQFDKQSVCFLRSAGRSQVSDRLLWASLAVAGGQPLLGCLRGRKRPSAKSLELLSSSVWRWWAWPHCFRNKEGGFQQNTLAFRSTACLSSL